MKFDLTPTQAVVELTDRISKGETRQAAHFIVWYIEDLISLKRFDEIDAFIGLISPDVNVWASSAILRSSYACAEHLTNWPTFLNDVREANKDNPRINRILVGLDKPYRSSFY